jgi:hypothetical protein
MSGVTAVLGADVLGGSRVPLAICFAAFVITFIVTRVITRMIRAGRGPFKDNVSESGLHIHHAVPGIILLVIGAFIAVGVDPDTPWGVASALLVGVGTSLVLDEFALILRLDDVYWLEEGRISIEMVSLAIGCLGLVLVGAEPFNFLKDDHGKITIESALLALAIVVPWLVVCVLKGKYRLTLFGLFVFPVAIFGAVRLARPASRWAKWRYRPKKMERADRRTARQDARWDPISTWVSDFVAGKPSSTAADPAGEPAQLDQPAATPT